MEEVKNRNRQVRKLKNYTFKLDTVELHNLGGLIFFRELMGN